MQCSVTAQYLVTILSSFKHYRSKRYFLNQSLKSKLYTLTLSMFLSFDIFRPTVLTKKLIYKKKKSLAKNLLSTACLR